MRWHCVCIFSGSSKQRWLTLLEAALPIRQTQAHTRRWRPHVIVWVAQNCWTNWRESKELHRYVGLGSGVPVAIAGFVGVTGTWEPPHITLNPLWEEWLLIVLCPPTTFWLTSGLQRKLRQEWGKDNGSEDLRPVLDHDIREPSI